MSLLEHLATPARLEMAWQEIRDNDPGDDPSPALARFEENAPARLTELSEALLNGDYRPRPLTRIELPKDSGGVRVLDIPAVVDRVAERALLNVVTPIVDPLLSPAAFGYRSGLGVADAVQRVVACREQGLGWVLRTDVDECFPTIPRDLAVGLLVRALPDESVTTLVQMLTTRRTSTRWGLRDVPGIPQGTSLSPLLSNLVLTDLDDALLDRGFPTVRFGDDLAVMCASRTDAEEALAVARRAVQEVGMSLGTDKTEIVDFATGFCFLGEDFGPKYPPLVAEHRVEEPTKQTLFVGLQGGRVRVRDGRVVVQSKDDVEALSVPSSHVARIVLFGSVGLSAGARSWTLGQGVDTVFLSRRGSYLGTQVAASNPTRVGRLRAQLATADDPDRSMRFARAVVAAKIRHQITLIQRFSTREDAEERLPALEMMRAMRALAPDAVTGAELMGVEGAAAKAYFEAFSLLLPEDMRFATRTRRPPQDVVNSALGYGYAVLLGECVGALAACGLDPGIGMLHADDDRRPSLALDLMEEFRPLIVDQAVVSMCRHRTLTPEHGERRAAESGVLLTKKGKKALVDGYEKRMLQVTGGAIPGFRGSWRHHLYRQAQRLAAFVTDPGAEWTGLSWR
ncbi:MAG: CRISPR-associated endonuclease Cas1 [Micrococcales bacterium]|nr:CRISPR-associated endonuclease Cas1 [Micrococcales bacterium]